ncbi:unnamed protein product [Sphacelaria rigidula]
MIHPQFARSRVVFIFWAIGSQQPAMVEQRTRVLFWCSLGWVCAMLIFMAIARAGWLRPVSIRISLAAPSILTTAEMHTRLQSSYYWQCANITRRGHEFEYVCGHGLAGADPVVCVDAWSHSR